MEVAAGLEESGVEVKRYQFAETLSDEVVGKMGGIKKPDFPVINHEDLPSFDGILLGFGTRYGRAPAQVCQSFFTLNILNQFLNFQTIGQHFL